MSAGALHAIRILIVPLAGAGRVFAYDPIANSVDLLHMSAAIDVQAFRARVAGCLPKAAGMALAFIGDRALAETAYEYPETLLWRDSGALVQTLAMVTHAEGHAFCALGIHSTEMVTALDLFERFLPLGAAVIGRKP